MVLKEYTQTCTIVGTDYPVKGDDPKKPFYFIFFFLPLAILIVSNTAMCIKVKVILRDLNNTQKAENAFIGMLGITFVFWLLFILPFILVDTLLDSCFQKPGLHAAAYIFNWTKVCTFFAVTGHSRSDASESLGKTSPPKNCPNYFKIPIMIMMVILMIMMTKSYKY